MRLGTLSLTPTKFQYPLRVEVGCNAWAFMKSGRKWQFQYPLRVEVGCNTATNPISFQASTFQYPLRVEVGCNSTCVCPQSTSTSSFSTLYGSKWVATTMKNTRMIDHVSFSTLYGSKWVATTVERVHWEALSTFQYPLRVEVGCNLCCNHSSAFGTVFQYPLRVEVGCKTFETIEVENLFEFQYPLRVEVGCNLQVQHLRSCPPLCFSTLYGSKWVATKAVCSLRMEVAVSVPSTGRSGLQPRWCRCRSRRLGVSVPSTGRSGLQRR